MECSNDGRLLLEYQTRQPRWKPFTPVTKKKVPTKTFQFFYRIKPGHLRELLPKINRNLHCFFLVFVKFACVKKRKDSFVRLS